MVRYLVVFLLCQAGLMASPFIPRMRCPNDFSFMGELLYLSAPSETVYFANEPNQTGNQSIDGTNFANAFDGYSPAYSIALAYTFPCETYYVSATWTSFKKSHFAQVGTANGVNDVFVADAPPSLYVFPPGRCDFATSEHEFTFYALDGIMGQAFLWSNGLELDLFGGIQYAHFIAIDNLNYVSVAGQPTVTGKKVVTMVGLGPEIGANASIKLYNHFSLLANATGGFLMGKPRSEISYITNGLPRWIGEIERVDRCVPFNTLRLGIHYDFCCSQRLAGLLWGKCRPQTRAGLEIGYQAFVYFNALSVIIPYSNQVIADCINEFRNVIMHGPYGRISITF